MSDDELRDRLEVLDAKLNRVCLALGVDPATIDREMDILRERRDGCKVHAEPRMGCRDCERYIPRGTGR